MQFENILKCAPFAIYCHSEIDFLDIMKAIVVLLVLAKLVECKNDFTINFVKSFIQAERKPTQLIYSGLCWRKNLEVKLINEVTELGIRCSSSITPKFEYLDHRSYQDHHLLFLVDLECHESENVFLYATTQDLFQFPFRWLVLSSRSIDPTNTTLWRSPIYSDSDVVLAEDVEGKYLLTELHRLTLSSPMQSTPRGYFDGKLEDTRLNKELFWRRNNLMGHPLTMSIVIQDSNDSLEHIIKEDRLDLQNDATPKIGWIAAQHAFDMLNATPRYIFSYRWGYLLNGTWSGMINDLLSRKADIGTNCVLFPERMDVATFTDVVNPLRMRFVFRQPPLTSVANIFSLPFSTGVWLSVAVCVVVSTAALFITSKWEQMLEPSADQLDGSVGDALLLSLSALAQQGCYFEPRRASGRILEWVLFTALMAIFAAYSANILVLLQAPSNSIRTLAQLAGSKIKLAALKVDYSKFILNDTNDAEHILVNKRVMPENGNPEFYDIYDGVERIRQGMFAFHSVVEAIYRRVEETFLETEKCDLTEVDYLNGFPFFTPVKKDSPYLDMIRVVYKRLSESGIRAALLHRYQVRKPRCSGDVAAFSSVGLLDLEPVMVFMVLGASLSVLILFAEIVHYKLTVHRKKKKENRKPISATE